MTDCNSQLLVILGDRAELQRKI